MSNTTQMPTKSVFINCPYDDEYREMMYIIIFLVAKFGCIPCIAVKDLDSSDRMHKILEMIKNSSIGIHDISRTEYSSKNQLARFNMPFELGIDYANKLYRQKNKKLLIIENKKYLSKITLSDLSGVDIEAHSGKVNDLIKIIRDFFCSIFSLKNVVSLQKLYYEFFVDFNTWFMDKAIKLGFSRNKYLSELSLSEIINYTLEYVNTVGGHY